LQSRPGRTGTARPAGFLVGNQLYHWEEGKALIFDDAYEHEACESHLAAARRAVCRFREAVAISGKPHQNWLVLHLAKQRFYAKIQR
jgi:hypothetical protein